MSCSSPDNLPCLSFCPTTDGLHLADTILWFDAKRAKDLSFHSSALISVNNQSYKIIATGETIKLVEICYKRLNALTCQYNRPFAIGKLRMELLPSGAILGGASLYIEITGKSILYAPYLQIQKNPTVKQMQLKRADVLILAANLPSIAAMPCRDQEKARLLAEIKTSISGTDSYPVIYCNFLATAQELCRLLSENQIPFAVHPIIAKINRVYESHRVSLGRYSIYSRSYKTTKKRVVIFPLGNKKLGYSTKYPGPKGPIFYVENSMVESPPPDVYQKVKQRFYISATSDVQDLKQVISAVAPSQIYIFGPYTKQYAAELAGSAASVKTVYKNHQPTLF